MVSEIASRRSDEGVSTDKVYGVWDFREGWIDGVQVVGDGRDVKGPCVGY